MLKRRTLVNLLIALAACLSGAWAQPVGTPNGAAPAPPPLAKADDEPTELVRFNFKDSETLRVNTGSIAVRADANSPLQLTAALSGLPVAIERVESWPIPGWWLVHLRQPVSRPLSEVIAAAAGTAGIDFASPVLVGADGGPVFFGSDVLVGFERSLSAANVQDALNGISGAVVVEQNFGGMPLTYRLRVSTRNGIEALGLANTLAQRDDVLFAEPDWIFTGRGGNFPNDPGFPACWGLHNTGQSGGVADMDMDASEAWDITAGSSSIIVAVLDTGVQQDHPDINQVPGADFTTDAGDGGPVNQCDNHGTAVAGCVTATMDNGIGTVGVAPNCRTVSTRTFISRAACDGRWTSSASWTVNALDWAESIGARVTNNSNGYGFTSSAIEQKYIDLREMGMVHFASAGNDAGPSIGYPASLPSVNAVAALERHGNRASFSNYGPGLAFSAPGASIYTTDRTGSAGYSGGDNVYLQGTSFASPYIAGVAALVLSRDPSLGASDVEDILEQTSVDLGSPGYDTNFGWGFVNAAAAVTVSNGCPSIEAFEPSSDQTVAPGASVVVAWDGYDPDHDAEVRLAYDTDLSESNGYTYMIPDWLDEEDGSLIWDTTSIPEGTYYILAIITDPNCYGFGYAPGSVTITTDDCPSIQVTEPVGDITVEQGESVSVAWDGTDSDDEAVVRLGYDTDLDFANGVMGWFASNQAEDGTGMWDTSGIPDSVYYLVAESNDGQCTGYGYADGSVTVYVQTINEDLKLLASDGAAIDHFGVSIAIDNGVVAVGVEFDDDNGNKSGSAYLFNASTGAQIAKLLPSDGAAYDEFGHSIAIANGVVAVGAIYDDDNGSNSGSAYLFDASTGVQIAKLLANDGATGDRFSWSIAIANGVAAVGASGDDDNGGGSGSAYLFDASTGAQIAKLLASDGASSDQFGIAIAIDNSVVAVGAYADDNGPQSGSAYLFDASAGAQIAKLLPSDGAAFDSFGDSISIDNGIVAVGASRDDDNGTDSGSAYVFEQINGGPECPADLNDDGLLDFFDVQQFLNYYSLGDLRADFIADGLLDFFDVSAFLQAFSAGCP
jgi:subtilisin family serine protease